MKTRNIFTRTLLAVFILATGFQANAQEQMITYLKDASLTQQQQHYLSILEKDLLIVKEYWIAQIDHEVLKSHGFIVSNPWAEEFSTQTVQTKSHGRDFYSWYGFIGDHDWQTSITNNKGMVHATLNLGDLQFVVKPLGEGLHVVYKTESARELGCGTDHNQIPAEDRPQPVKPVEPNEDEKQFESSPVPDSGTSRGGADCNVRILVAYTTSVDNNTPDIKGFIQNMVNYWNGAQTNSNVGHNVELARSVEVAYTESGTTTNHATYGTKSTDLLRFWNQSDGWMDNIGDQRSLYDADLCILLVDDLQGSSGAIGGQAMVIGATYSEGYCAMWYLNVTPTFPHEFGHLYGCRHDTYVDNNTTPFSYGHGYVWIGSGTNFRTIMAYDNECDDAGVSCNRIQNWSNPGITSGGNATGTTLTEDNARVNDVQASTMAGFEASQTNKVFYDSDNITIDECVDMYGHNSITTDATETIYFFNGSEGTFRAGSYIVLQEGFRAYSGTTFEARLESCNDLMTSGGGSHREAELPEGMDEIDEMVDGIKIHSYPNPFHETHTIKVTLPETAQVKVSLTSMIGNYVMMLENSELMAGTHDLTIDGRNLAAGVYHVSIEIGEKSFSRRIIKAD